MTKTIVFKTLVDFLYMLHVLGLISILFTVPLGIININQADLSVSDWTIWHWSIVVLTFITYTVFLRGLYFLRKTARFLLSNKYFSNHIIDNLKQSGYHFLYTGLLSVGVILIVFVSKLYQGTFELIFDDNLLIPLFISIIGLFFIIQSHSLLLAKDFKEENELTI
ncbi:DUF2975 domain-containing protein [Formosa algae]|uniref:Cation transport ATPase n=1 Tax=Formosa algae TaxID=225843 RepID=A0A9X1CCY5_9FLAO|nr:DUF2975 domain-containing protein [Formosa algae]MBP1840634.1 cation transport ATPase [Formosa algae]MDQ0335953.1 cation transport ATPase [Formosa algae]OEI81153.1 hypothetical protein AST99_05705 [Formosa algae]